MCWGLWRLRKLGREDGVVDYGWASEMVMSIATALARRDLPAAIIFSAVVMTLEYS